MERLRLLRKEKKRTQAQMASLLGISQQAYATYENDTAQPPKDIFIRLADYFQVSVDYLLGRESKPFDYAAIGLMPIRTKKVPLLGTIACGTPILAQQNVEDYIDMKEDLHADFCLRCKGDSMINARIFDGDIVYIRIQETVENGEIAAVLIDGEATLKRFFKYENSIELRADNPTFKSLYLTGEQEVRIIGKAVAFLSEVR